MWIIAVNVGKGSLSKFGGSRGRKVDKSPAHMRAEIRVSGLGGYHLVGFQKQPYSSALSGNFGLVFTNQNLDSKVDKMM